MASTRASSPAEGVSAPNSPQLTPRSKIKAMLAAVDNQDSDDEVTGPIDAKELFKSIEKSRSTKDKSLSAHGSDNDDDAEEEEDEEEIVRPRGRIAARMHSAYNQNTDAASKPSNQEKANTTKGADKDEDEEEDEDDEVSAQPRRRLARKARSTTPEAAPDTVSPSSPTLFVSPSPSKPVDSTAGSDTEEEFPVDLSKSARFNALLARKRQERLEKEAEEERKREERAQRMAEQMPLDSGADDDDVSDISDDDGGRRLTQEVSRPSRKASKKALEEMNRETQRISRSLQLAHEAKTKKKISKASLFERFNFKTKEASKEGKPPSSSRPTTPGSNHQTDAEMGDSGTPPSSPPVALKPSSDAPASEALPTVENTIANLIGEGDKEDLSDLVVAMRQPKVQEKGKGKEHESTVEPMEAKKSEVVKPKRQVRVKLPPVQANLVSIDSDEELEITTSKKGRLDAIFDRVPEQKDQESKSLVVLRRLAQLSSPPKEPSRNRNARSSMTPGELQMTLQQRARAQAKLERERRLEYLRSKGVVVQSAEEREREREQVEDIVARARQEAEEIMQREREDAKRARKEEKENGEADPLAWDDSDDDSFEGSEEGEPAELELSGSEEEDEENVEESGDEADDGDEDKPAANAVFIDEAEEDEEPEEETTPKAILDDDSDDEVDQSPAIKSRRQKKHPRVVSDDEDTEVQATPKAKTTRPRSPSAPGSGSPKAPTSVLRSATKPFIPGLPVPAAGPAGLGLTQIFAGTMDDSQTGPSSGSPQEFMPSLDQFPGSQFSATASEPRNDDMVLDSQPSQRPDTQSRDSQNQGVELHFSQSQAHGFDSFMQMDSTQMSDFIEPTQDGGFQDFSPLKQRFVDAPQSTVDTVVLEGTPDYEKLQESPLVRKRGKLRRRGQSSLSISSLPPTETPLSPSARRTAPEAENATTTTSAFRLMEKAARRKKRMQEKFDKKKSKANEMIEEQAEESEDEYAGLGGADGEDSSEEDEELVKEMIDDTAGNDADEAKLAGFFADRERAADAAQVDKLFHDITTGMLRKRRRGGGGGDNDFDLSDSDDGGEARRRLKRRQFAKMQKALFADERIGKIAENPRNAAFLKSIEDRNSDDEWDFGDNFADSAAPHTSTDSDSQSQNETAIPDSQPANLGRKRTRTDDHTAARPPPNVRRVTKDKDVMRPASLSDVRRSVSSLLEPNGSAGSIIPATEIGGSDSENEDGNEDHPSATASDKENHSTTATVVDRIALKRNASSGGGSSSRLAFAAPMAAGGPGGFKVPALLRRATTNSLISNSSSSSSSTAAPAAAAGGAAMMSAAAVIGAGDADGKLKKNAGKRSGVNHFARENDRRAKVAEAEKRREAKKWKGAEGRGKVVGGLFGGGSFE
ncbi:MRC1-like domain-containing protein [Biscogniauxia mediterranea]|nr:MRC1-like domain-containing protein [Biscogniauxia mediterranea]